jgi:hypothetical protein
LSGQVPDHRSGAFVTARPDEQLAPNSPILRRLGPCISRGCDDEDFAFRTIVPQAFRCRPEPIPEVSTGSGAKINNTNGSGENIMAAKSGIVCRVLSGISDLAPVSCRP